MSDPIILTFWLDEFMIDLLSFGEGSLHGPRDEGAHVPAVPCNLFDNGGGKVVVFGVSGKEYCFDTGNVPVHAGHGCFVFKVLGIAHAFNHED